MTSVSTQELAVSGTLADSIVSGNGLSKMPDDLQIDIMIARHYQMSEKRRNGNKLVRASYNFSEKQQKAMFLAVAQECKSVFPDCTVHLNGNIRLNGPTYERVQARLDSFVEGLLKEIRKENFTSYDRRAKFVFNSTELTGGFVEVVTAKGQNALTLKQQRLDCLEAIRLAEAKEQRLLAMAGDKNREDSIANTRKHIKKLRIAMDYLNGEIQQQEAANKAINEPTPATAQPVA